MKNMFQPSPVLQTHGFIRLLLYDVQGAGVVKIEKYGLNPKP